MPPQRRSTGSFTDYGIPADSELGKPGCYIQNTPRVRVIEKRRKNDVVLVPVGCTENHGIHANSGLDTFMVTQICEGVRRYTAKQGREVVLAFPPLNYGGHPYHHIGMAGTVIMPEEVVRDTVIYTLLGLWDDGFRKIILVNNHGHLWMLESAVQEFFKRFELPALVTTVEWHRAVREFFYPTPRDQSMSTHFIHADEAETSVALLLFKDMIDMGVVVDAQGTNYTLGAHYDTSVDSFRRPQGWAQGQGHNAIERFGTPEAVVGCPSRGTAAKAKRPIAAILKYLTLMIDEILACLSGRAGAAHREIHLPLPGGDRRLPQGADERGLEVGARTAQNWGVLKPQSVERIGSQTAQPAARRSGGRATPGDIGQA